MLFINVCQHISTYLWYRSRGVEFQLPAEVKGLRVRESESGSRPNQRNLYIFLFLKDKAKLNTCFMIVIFARSRDGKEKRNRSLVLLFGCKSAEAAAPRVVDL
jgi:hypothetical protein